MCKKILGNFSNNDGDGYENVTETVNSRYFIALVPSRLIRQMLANFFGVEF